MDQHTIAAARALLPPNAIYADWAASALPLPSSHPPVFIPPAHTTADSTIDTARVALSKFLQDHHHSYHVIFTSGATAALSILAHRLPWSDNASFLVHTHVHNAVLGIRNPALAAGAQFRALRSDQLEQCLTIDNSTSCNTRSFAHNHCPSLETSPQFALLAYPGECNLTGVKYPFRWARLAKQNALFQYSPQQVITLIDSAKLAASGPLNLQEHEGYVDAFVFSLYKLTSSYTGLGALLVRKGSFLEYLLQSTARKAYFAGGRSVDAVSPFSNVLFEPSSSLRQQLELGTPNMQAVYHLPKQLSHFSPWQVMSAIRKHASVIAGAFRSLLVEAFSEQNVIIHTDRYVSNADKDSTIVSFTLYRSQRDHIRLIPVGHREILTVLEMNRIYARAGCMCNTGACASVLGLSDEDFADNYQLGHRCGDDMDLLQGKPTGIVRVSFGWASLISDAADIVKVLRRHVSIRITHHLPKPSAAKSPTFRVGVLLIYPVKSCGGYQVKDVISDGQGSIVGDRLFGIQNMQTGKLMSIKSNPVLANITARYNESKSSLILQWEGKKLSEEMEIAIEIELNEQFWERRLRAANDTKSETQFVRCNETEGTTLNDQCSIKNEKVTRWLTLTTGVESYLVMLGGNERYRDKDGSVLVVSKEELQRLAKESNVKSIPVIQAAIRPNVVLEEVMDSAVSTSSETEKPSIYDCDRLFCNCASFVSRRHCYRCSVVNKVTNSKGFAEFGEPLRTIARINQSCGRKGMVFGVLYHFSSEAKVKVNTILNTELKL